MREDATGMAKLIHNSHNPSYIFYRASQTILKKQLTLNTALMEKNSLSFNPGTQKIKGKKNMTPNMQNKKNYLVNLPKMHDCISEYRLAKSTFLLEMLNIFSQPSPLC